MANQPNAAGIHFFARPQVRQRGLGVAGKILHPRARELSARLEPHPARPSATLQCLRASSNPPKPGTGDGSGCAHRDPSVLISVSAPPPETAPCPDGMVSEPASLIPAALFSNETSSSVYGNGLTGSCRPASTFWAFSVYTYVWIICPSATSTAALVQQNHARMPARFEPECCIESGLSTANRRNKVVMIAGPGLAVVTDPEPFTGVRHGNRVAHPYSSVILFQLIPRKYAFRAAQHQKGGEPRKVSNRSLKYRIQSPAAYRKSGVRHSQRGENLLLHILGIWLARRPAERECQHRVFDIRSGGVRSRLECVLRIRQRCHQALLPPRHGNVVIRGQRRESSPEVCSANCIASPAPHRGIGCARTSVRVHTFRGIGKMRLAIPHQLQQHDRGEGARSNAVFRVGVRLAVLRPLSAKP